MADTTILQHYEGCLVDNTGCGYNHIGGRHSQEDTLGHGPGWWAVADGMGGHDQGEVASLLAMQAVEGTLGATSTPDQLIDTFCHGEDKVRNIPSHERHYPPGTTLTVAAVHPDRDRIVGAWCGDSPAYLWTPDTQSLTRLTVDHADIYGRIIGCLGMQMLRIEHFEVLTGHGHQLLICSDGLSGVFDDTYEMIAQLEHGPESLLNYAVERSHDNVTFALIDVDAFATSV